MLLYKVEAVVSEFLKFDAEKSVCGSKLRFFCDSVLEFGTCMCLLFQDMDLAFGCRLYGKYENC
jgi:hypothetical protein